MILNLDLKFKNTSDTQCFLEKKRGVFGCVIRVHLFEEKSSCITIPVMLEAQSHMFLDLYKTWMFFLSFVMFCQDTDQ